MKKFFIGLGVFFLCAVLVLFINYKKTNVDIPANDDTYIEESEVEESEKDDDIISWKDVGDYESETVKVKGDVVGTKYLKDSNGSPTMLNIGEDYPSDKRFTVIIWGENRDNFDGNPEETYLNEEVVVKGEIYSYNGIYQMEVTSPDDIKIVDDSE